MNTILEKLKRLLPSREDTQESLYFKIIIYVILGVIAVMIVVSLLTFFLSLENVESTKIPDVVTTEYKNVDMIDAILSLQERGLNARIQVKHSSKYYKGLVMEQTPKAGALVKVGRTVTLTISRGAVLDKVGGYVGREINQVRLELQEAFASSKKALLIIKEPVEYAYDDVIPMDKVISQIPTAGTALVENEVTELVLTISKGPDPRKKIDSFIGLDFKTVIDKIAKTGIPFLMTEETEANKEKAGVITFQEPNPGEAVALNSVIKLRYNAPKISKEEAKRLVYGRYEYMIREYDVPVPVRIQVVNSQGTTTLFEMHLKGGELNIPYILENNSEIILYVLDEAVDRYTVVKPEPKEDD